jgi:hypothetical protein
MRYWGILACGNMKGRDHLEELSVDGTIILKWILKQKDMWL